MLIASLGAKARIQQALPADVPVLTYIRAIDCKKCDAIRLLQTWPTEERDFVALIVRRTIRCIDT